MQEKRTKTLNFVPNNTTMPHLRIFLILSFYAATLLLPSPVQSLHAQTLPSLAERLAALAAEANAQPYYTGICVYDLTADQTVFESGAHKAMRPASTQKILTAVAALDRLGKDAVFTTQALQQGYMEGTTLVGNVVVRGGFDPVFSYDDLRRMARAIHDAGIDSIAGQLVADVSMTDGLPLGNGWCWDDVPSSLIPYLTPLLFNHEQDIDSRSKQCVEDPDQYFLRILQRELRQLGVCCRDGIAQPLAVNLQPATAQRVLYVERHTVEQTLGPMMKKSDNLHAEALFYLLGSSAKFSQTGWKDCAAQVENLLRKVGADTDNVSVADGSGLSLYNYVTPRTLVQVLRYAYLQPAIYTVLLPSLPVAGVDGTLERRMLRSPAQRNVRAKTGTCMGVITLAGYATAADGHHLAFAILCNGPMKGDAARALQDKICQELVR